MGQASNKMQAAVRNWSGGISFSSEQPRPDVVKERILVRVKAAGINPVDYKLPRLMGAIPGLDFAGVVEAVGEGVNVFKVGDEVYGNASGSLAEYVLAEPSKTARKPMKASFKEAAAMPTVYLTGLQGLRDHGAFKAGQNVCVIGASGGCGVAAVQIARALGASDIVGVCSARNADFVLDNGANRIVDYKTQTLADAHQSWTVKGPLNPLPLDAKCSQAYFDVVFDAASYSGNGEDYLAVAKLILKPNTGQQVLLNANAGKWMSTLTGIGGEENSTLILTSHSSEDLKILANMFDTAATAKEKATTAEKKVTKITEEKEVSQASFPFGPHIQRVFPLTAQGVQEGFDLLKSRRVRGKVIFDISCESASATTPLM